jgi:cysteinyl-tRNA synthetase
MLEFSFEALEEASVNFRRIEGFLTRAAEVLESEITPSLSAEFSIAMNDDLAVPAGLAAISEEVRLGNTALTANDLKALALHAGRVRGALHILGCDPFDPLFATNQGASAEVIDGLISLALEQRESARARKDFATSDSIRDNIAALGITLEDTPTGPRWSITNK